MGSLRTFAALTALLVISSQAIAQTDEDAFRYVARSPATGAVQLGMAGASRAGLGDWTDVASNPAGLGWLEQHQLAGSLASWNTGDEATYQLGSFSSFDKSTSNSLALQTAGYVYKAPVLRGSLAIGIGYNQNNSFNRKMSFDGQNDANSMTDYFMPLPTEFTINRQAGPDGLLGTSDDTFQPEFTRSLSYLAYQTYGIDFDRNLYDNGNPVPFLPAVVTGTVSQTGQLLEDGHAGEFTLASSIEAIPNVMLGGGINIAYGRYNFSRVYEEADINNANDGTGITTDFQSLRLVDNLKTDLVGANLRLGMSAKVNPQVLVGLTVESPSYYAVDEDYSTQLNTYFDNGDAYEQKLSGLNEYEIDTPWRLGGGASYSVAGLTLAADAEYVDWSQLKLRAKDHKDDFQFDDVNRFIKQNYDAVFNTRFGGSYDLGNVIVRAGYARQPDPHPTTDLKRDRNYYSAGVGFKVQQTIQLDIGWMQERFDDQYQPYTEVNGAPVVTEKVTRNRVSAGIRVTL